MSNHLRPRLINPGEQTEDIQFQISQIALQDLYELKKQDQVFLRDELRGAIDSYIHIEDRVFIVRSLERVYRSRRVGAGLQLVGVDLPLGQTVELNEISRIDSRPIALHLQFAIDYYIQARSNESLFRAHLDSHIRRHRPNPTDSDNV